MMLVTLTSRQRFNFYNKIYVVLLLETTWKDKYVCVCGQGYCAEEITVSNTFVTTS